MLVLLAACGGEEPKPPEIGSFAEAAERTVSGMREFGAILGGVEDLASAEAAAPRLEALAKKLRAVVAAIDRMPQGEAGPEIAGRVEEAFAALSPATTAYIDCVLEAPEIGEVLAGPYGDVQHQLRTLLEMLGG